MRIIARAATPPARTRASGGTIPGGNTTNGAVISGSNGRNEGALMTHWLGFAVTLAMSAVFIGWAEWQERHDQ